MDGIIFGDYKIGVNPQIGPETFLLPNIETASYELARMKNFVEIDLM